jgi:hypothetical protein
MRQSKAQSAMEYLMTYGWALVILAVVAAALYQLGVFGGISSASSTCVAAPGYYCANPMLSQNDNITFTFGQFTSSKIIYNVAAACSSFATSSGLPNPSPPSGTPYAAMVYLSATGAATAVVSNSATSGSLSLSPGQKITVTGLTCYGTKVGPTITPTVGTGFSGNIWINYTTSSGAPSSSNPLHTEKVATLSVKVLK